MERGVACVLMLLVLAACAPHSNVADWWELNEWEIEDHGELHD